MDIEGVASMAIVTPDPADSRKLFVDALGLPLTPQQDGDDYFFSEKIDGARHFGVWPLHQAAEACFGSENWPSDRPLPQACFEFEVGSEEKVQAGADELKDRGYTLIHGARTEPWGQTVARLQTPEGVIVGISFVPWAHGDARAGQE